MLGVLLDKLDKLSSKHKKASSINVERNYKLPVDPREGVLQLLIEELKYRIDRKHFYLVRVSRKGGTFYLHMLLYAQKVDFNRVYQNFQYPSIIRVLCVLKDLHREGDYTISYFDSNRNIIEEHRFTTLSAFLTHIDTMESRVLDSSQLHYRNLKPYPMGTLSQQHSLISLLYFRQDFKSELVSKRGYNGEVLRECTLVYEDALTTRR